MAKLGREYGYKAFIPEKVFMGNIKSLNFEIIDQKFFNIVSLKNIEKIIPPDSLDDFNKRWLDFEIWLNNTGIKYDDSRALIFGTPNFILVHK